MRLHQMKPGFEKGSAIAVGAPPPRPEGRLRRLDRRPRLSGGDIGNMPKRSAGGWIGYSDPRSTRRLDPCTADQRALPEEIRVLKR